MAWHYAVVLERDDDGSVMATVPALPEVVTFGDDEQDALARVVDAIETALAACIADRRDIPAPGERDAHHPHHAAPSLLAVMKIELYQAMRAKGWRKADLARALNVDPRQVDRLFDLNHATPVRQLEAAVAACGMRIEPALRVFEDT
jgi:antitoxin HicB